MAINYDEAAQAYARNRHIHPGVFEGLVNGLTDNSRVLEVGCGTGNYIIALQEMAGCACRGIDPSEGMLAQALARGSAVEFLPGRAETLPFLDASFDLIYSVDVIHHVADPAAAYCEAFRALAPGGWICTVTDSEEIIRRRAPLSVYFPETVEPELRRYPPIAVLRKWMRAAGFGAMYEETVEISRQINDIQAYHEKSYSSLHLIPEEAFRRGIERMKADLRKGPIPGLSLYILLWGRKEM